MQTQPANFIIMMHYTWQDRLADVLNQLWEELKEKVTPPKPELKRIPVERENQPPHFR